LKKLSSFVCTDKWLICLPKCSVSSKPRTQLWTAFFIFRYYRGFAVFAMCTRGKFQVASTSESAVPPQQIRTRFILLLYDLQKLCTFKTRIAAHNSEIPYQVEPVSLLPLRACVRGGVQHRQYLHYIASNGRMKWKG
jgi:hypothetical protein